MNYLLSVLAEASPSLPKHYRKSMINVLQAIYPNIDFWQFYNPIDNIYSDPDNIIVHSFLELF